MSYFSDGWSGVKPQPSIPSGRDQATLQARGGSGSLARATGRGGQRAERWKAKRAFPTFGSQTSDMPIARNSRSRWTHSGAQVKLTAIPIHSLMDAPPGVYTTRTTARRPAMFYRRIAWRIRLSRIATY